MEGCDLLLRAGRGCHREEILRLRRDTYCCELGYGAEAACWTALDDRATQVVALTRDGQAAAAMRLLGPHDRPFELENNVNLPEFLRSGHPPGEVTRFCIAAKHRTLRRGLELQMRLMRFLYDTCRSRGVSDLFICARPSARKLYEFLLFEALTPADIRYGPLQGERHLLMRLEVSSLPSSYALRGHPFRRAFEPVRGFFR